MGSARGLLRARKKGLCSSSLKRMRMPVRLNVSDPVRRAQLARMEGRR